MKNNMKKQLIGTSILVVLSVQSAFADTIKWTDWTSATEGVPGSANGAIQLDSASTIAITYSGDVKFAQTGIGTNYWTEGTPPAYTGNTTVGNAPPAAEMIALASSGITNTITFSQPIDNPIMAIVSMGQAGIPISYTFDTPFTVLGEGSGYWGDGSYTISDNTLTGTELHGVIQFNGTVSSISWTASPEENWHGFTIGLPTQTTIDPGTVLTVPLTGIITTRNWEYENDEAQFKLTGMQAVKDDAAVAITDGLEMTIAFGATCDNPIYQKTVSASELNTSNSNQLRYTEGNLDVVRCIYSTGQCVINIKPEELKSLTDGDGNILDDLCSGPLTVCLTVGNTTYTNSGTWTQYDSGSGSWTKCRKDIATETN